MHGLEYSSPICLANLSLFMIKARVSLSASLFDDYIFHSEEGTIQLSLNLPTFLDCLSLFGSNLDDVSATITYSVSNHVITLSTYGFFF